MAISLSEAKNNATDAVDVQVIDEFRKESVILDTMVFDDVVSPSGGGATLTYGYRRLNTQATANFRGINSEYTPQNVTTSKHSVDLAVLGGAFEVDRVVAKIGPAASNAVNLNMQQKIKAARAKFQDAIINGDTSVEVDGFDGLDKALRGSTTEKNMSTLTDWTDFDTDTRAPYKALDLIDEWLGMLNGAPTIILGNNKALARVRAAARRASLYTKDPVADLVGADGRPIVREMYGNILFADPGDQAGSTNPIIPVYRQANKVITVTASSGDISFKLNGVTVTVAYDATAAALEEAIEAIVPDATVTKNTTFKVLYPVGRYAVFEEITDGGCTIADATAGDAPKTGLTSLYAYRVAMDDGFHGVSTVGGQLVQTYLPDFTSAGAVKKGEVELGPVGVALKATKGAAVLRGIKVQ